MKRALTLFNNSVKVERTLKDEIKDLIEFICTFDWDKDWWVSKSRDSKLAEWSSSINEFKIKVVITVRSNKQTNTQVNTQVNILDENHLITRNSLYEMEITIIGDVEKAVVRELKGRFEKKQLLNGKNSVPLAKKKLRELEQFLLNKGKEEIYD